MTRGILRVGCAVIYHDAHGRAHNALVSAVGDDGVVSAVICGENPLILENVECVAAKRFGHYWRWPDEEANPYCDARIGRGRTARRADVAGWVRDDAAADSGEFLGCGDGLWYRGGAEASVTLVITGDGEAPVFSKETNISAVYVIPDNIWASVLAHVSAGGADDGRWNEAMTFHHTPDEILVTRKHVETVGAR